MRNLALISAAALCLATPAAAQHAPESGGSMGAAFELLNRATSGAPFNQWAATRPTALAGLSQNAQLWMKTEVQRQAETPRDPVDVAIDIDQTIGPDVAKFAKQEHAEPEQITGAILLKIMYDTKIGLKAAAYKADGRTETGFRPWNERIAEAEANMDRAKEIASSYSVKMALD